MIFRQPPVVLTFLAPANQCNQRCPSCYITEVVGEPVHDFELLPEHYARFVEQFVEAEIPILGVNFQGYEVTLPRSWPYVESVFALAKKHQVRRSFITNGMLLYKHTDRIEALDPSRIAVSIDGCTPEIHDPIRGLPGSFLATRRSIERFLSRLPTFRERMVVVSTLYSEDNFRSLGAMPDLLTKLGISRWALGFESRAESGRAQPAQTRATLVRWLGELQQRGEAAGITVFVNDELGLLEADDASGVRTRSVFDSNFLYRFDPRGYVRSGVALLDVWSAQDTARWHPTGPPGPAVVGYNSARRRRAESLTPTSMVR